MFPYHAVVDKGSVQKTNEEFKNYKIIFIELSLIKDLERIR